MAFQRFMIAPFDENSGLNTNLRPWLIPDKAFEKINNAYVFRGRIRKRFGSTFFLGTDGLQSRLRVNLPGGAGIGVTDGAGNANGTVPGNAFAIGQQFSIGTQVYTVNQTGTPANMLNTGAGTGTYDTTTGVYTFAGAPTNTQIYFYPAQPVMGLITYETAPINDEPLYAFDQQFAYEFSGGWQRLGTAVWSGSTSQFFWGTTWRGTTSSERILYVTNFNATDGIRYWDGTTWTTLNPDYLSGGNNRVVTARIIVSFKNRLVLFNTIETVGGVNTPFVNRCRFSQVGSPQEADAWIQAPEQYGKGGFIDASTSESIITVEFIKDRLIVFFERSTWELVYTGNQVLPFVFQKINTELGAESTFSVVPFDKVALGVGNVGIHACNGSNVERIDQNIPQEVFNIHNNNQGIERVYGIRDYYTEMVYWTFPDADRDDGRIFPNKVLVYSYLTGTWAFNDDSITAFGYFQNPATNTWASTTLTWQEAIQTWSSATMEAKFRQVIAGNQEGYTFIIDSDSARNAPALQITDIITTPTTQLTIVNHNLDVGDYILIENTQGITGINDNIYQVSLVIDDNTIDIGLAPFTGTYTGAGLVARVSQIDILTKQYNPYAEKGTNFFVQKVDFMVDKTTNGQVTLDYYTSSSDISTVTDGQATQSILGNNVLETSPYALVPLEQEQSRLWHPVYFQTQGEVIQFRIYLNDAQMRVKNIALSDFQLHAFIMYMQPTGRLE